MNDKELSDIPTIDENFLIKSINTIDNDIIGKNILGKTKDGFFIGKVLDIHNRCLGIYDLQPFLLGNISSVKTLDVLMEDVLDYYVFDEFLGYDEQFKEIIEKILSLVNKRCHITNIYGTSAIVFLCEILNDICIRFYYKDSNGEINEGIYPICLIKDIKKYK